MAYKTKPKKKKKFFDTEKKEKYVVESKGYNYYEKEAFSI